MPRDLKPHGSYAAYRRHKRAGEDPCDRCAQAAREQANERLARKRQSLADAAQAALPPAVDPMEPIDSDVILRESLRTLRAHLLTAPPQSIAGIAKAIRETLEAIQGPATDQEAADDDDALSDIARAYAQRGA